MNLDTLKLQHGSHPTFEAGACLMEAVAFFANEPHSDTPRCVSLVLRDLGIELNDGWGDGARQKLKPLIPLMVGTAGDGQDEARSYLALDWLIRTFTPAWLDLAGLTIEAQELRDLHQVVDLPAARAAGAATRAAAEAATRAVTEAAAWAAAEAATRAVTEAAAWAAIAAAAGDAAGGAVGAAIAAAAGDATRAATRAAAGAAAGAAGAAAGAAGAAAVGGVLRPTVRMLQDSAVDLFHRMIDPAAEIAS